MNLSDEIQNELKQVAPYLASLSKPHPFKAPSTYFEELEMKLISSINKQEKNGEATPSISKEHPFSVPDSYFNELPSNIVLKIKREESQGRKIKTTSAITRKISDYKLWLAAASIAIVMVVSASLFMKHQSTEIASGKITTDSVVSDLLYASQVDEAMVVELYLLDQQSNSSSDNANDDNNFLRDVTDIDPNAITGM